MRALAVSLGGLGVTAVLQVIVVAVLADRIEHELGHVNGIDGVDRLRVRWIGHELHADADVAVNATLDLTHTHDLLEDARHRLLHTIPRLTDVLLHANPAGCHHAHERLRHHDRHAAA